MNLTYIGEAVGLGARLTYFLQGPEQGETVVLLPGMGRGADDFHDLAASLNDAGYRTVAIQPRGIGRSGPILTNPTYDQFADDVALILKDIPGGIAGGKAHVLGYEFGNRVARMFAVNYMERVQSLVLLACGGQEVSSSQSDTNASKATQSDPGAAKSAPGEQSPGTKAPILPSDITKNIDSYFRHLAEEAKGPKDVTLSGMTAIFAFWLQPDVREFYVQHAFFSKKSKVPYDWITGWYRDTGWMQKGLDKDHSSTSAAWVSGGKAPMLIIQGADDVAATVANGVYMEKEYPDRVTLVVVPEAGHAMLAEKPEFIADLIKSYLAQNQIVK
jgi:pimeloyl-ACP methyl ester carboxylesterase